MSNDDDIFPPVFYHAFEWFYGDVLPANKIESVLSGMPHDILEEMKNEKEMYAAGILRLKKKYPAIYKHYKDDWDEIFEELTAGFNREMKRDLRRY